MTRPQIRNHSTLTMSLVTFFLDLLPRFTADIVTDATSDPVVVVGIRRSASGNNERAAPSARCAFGTSDTLHGGSYNRCLRTTSRTILASSSAVSPYVRESVVRVACARAERVATRRPLQRCGNTRTVDVTQPRLA